jgi:hypothetical protein
MLVLRNDNTLIVIMLVCHTDVSTGRMNGHVEEPKRTVRLKCRFCGTREREREGGEGGNSKKNDKMVEIWKN